jgi:predicted phage terminase large subunit-like protein
MNPPTDQKIYTSIAENRAVRQAVTRESHLMFFHIYFPHYVTYEIAEFQKEIFRITEDRENRLAVIVAFRGSGKSTLVTFSYVLWAILGIQQKKFVVIIGQTRPQAKQLMMNIRRELDNNALLRNDLGPFQEESDEWGSSSLVFSKIGARITVASSEQSIRGLRHNQYRPDLVILDDIEDMSSVKTYDSRQKTYNWFTGEVAPLGDKSTRILVVGNLLHEDSLVMRLKKDIEQGARDGMFRKYPLLSATGKIAWPGKYPDDAAVQEEKRRSGNEYAWQREFLLNIVPDADQVIQPKWIQYYDEIPQQQDTYRATYVGVDLAISERETADYTAIVCALVVGHGKDFRAYILPTIINRRMNFPDTIRQITEIYNAVKTSYKQPRVLVEDVGYQRAVIEQLNHQGTRAEGVKITSDKRSRLITLADAIQRGKIRFPKHGGQELVRQILGFGVEPHDDLVDAFSLLAHKCLELDKGGPSITWITVGGTRRDPYSPLGNFHINPGMIF